MQQQEDVKENIKDYPHKQVSRNKIETLQDDKLIEYMYQMVLYAESDELYDHWQIYTHDTAHIEYGLYENIEASTAFGMYLHRTEAIKYTEDKNMAYMYNLG